MQLPVILWDTCGRKYGRMCMILEKIHGNKQRSLSCRAIRSEVCFGYISAIKLHCDWLFHDSTMAVAAPGMHVVRQTE